MELKNFKPGQVWKMRAGGHVGIESISDDGGTHVVYARDLDTGSARNFNASGGYLNDGQATSDFDLVELARDADVETDSAEFKFVKPGEDMPDELKALLGGLFKRIADKASAQTETGGCAACTEANSRAFADHLIVTSFEQGVLESTSAVELMKYIQEVMAARKALTV